jgi:glycine cleavage system aminomethyltransferase T
VVGRLRSVAFGPAVGATIGYVSLDWSIPVGTGLELDVFDRRVAAIVVEDVSIDPRGMRMAG